MGSKYLVVDKSILPGYYEKVVEARKLLESGKVKDASQAAKQVGIFRSTYYKYRDYVMELDAGSQMKRAIISMMLDHEPGVLLRIIQVINSFSYSIWTINQNPPVHEQANVVIAIDLVNGTRDLDDMMDEIGVTAGVKKVSLLGIE